MSAVIKTQVATSNEVGPGKAVLAIYGETRKLRADFLRHIRCLQREAGISEKEMRAIERAHDLEGLPDSDHELWREEIEQVPSSRNLDDLAHNAVIQLTRQLNMDWLEQEAAKPYRLDSVFLAKPLHLVNGVRVGFGAEAPGPQRFARMLLLSMDHLMQRMDLDFFLGATLIPECAALGNCLDEIKTLGSEAERKLQTLPQMTDDQVSSTIYELLVGAACVRKGLNLTMIPEDRVNKVPDYRITNLHQVPAVIECKRRRGLTEYELEEAKCFEDLYSFVRPVLLEQGVHGCFEISFNTELSSVNFEDFKTQMLHAIEKPDREDPMRTPWGSLRFRTLPFRRSITGTRLYSPEYLNEVFDWDVLQDQWDGLLCEVETPSRLDVEIFTRPICLKWRSDSEQALKRKARGIKSLWADAAKQIPDGEIGFVYIAYPEGSRAPIADMRTRQIMTELNEVWYRWSIRLPATIVGRLYGRALGIGYPDFIENVLLAASKGQEHWLKDLPHRVFVYEDH